MEMLVVIRELENLRHLLENTKFKFEVWTDHKNLEYFMKVEQKSSLLDIIFVKIQFHLKTCTRNEDGESK